jgi:uncharacterized protein
MLRANEVIALLHLEPLAVEGGFFSETYRCPEGVPLGPGGERSLSTAIYYLLRDQDVSKLHRLRSDEIFHFYAGDPVEMLLLRHGGGEIVTLGADLAGGMRPQVVVPREVWQGCRLKPGGSWALLGTTVSPGFDYEDFEAGDGASLASAYPEFAEHIGILCP